MNQTMRMMTISTLMMIGPTAEFARANSNGPAKQIVIDIRNYAQIDENVLRQASEIASNIFQRAGVEVIITNELAEGASISPSDLPRLCHLKVNILSPEMARRMGLRMQALGVAPGSDVDHNRTTVYIFGDVAAALVQQQEIAGMSHILGHALAHEIGHVLLNLANHSHTGLMQATWEPKDFRAMNMGRLTFRDEEVSRIQAEITRRNER
jgi:hypothetical protein